MRVAEVLPRPGRPVRRHDLVLAVGAGRGVLGGVAAARFDLGDRVHELGQAGRILREGRDRGDGGEQDDRRQHGDGERPEAPTRDRQCSSFLPGRRGGARRASARAGAECMAWGPQVWALRRRPGGGTRSDRIGAWGEPQPTAPAGLPARPSAPDLRSQEGRHPVQRVVEDRLEAVAQARVRHQLRVAQQRDLRAQQVDPRERVALARQQQDRARDGRPVGDPGIGPLRARPAGGAGS